MRLLIGGRLAGRGVRVRQFDVWISVQMGLWFCVCVCVRENEGKRCIRQHHDNDSDNDDSNSNIDNRSSTHPSIHPSIFLSVHSDPSAHQLVKRSEGAATVTATQQEVTPYRPLTDLPCSKGRSSFLVPRSHADCTTQTFIPPTSKQNTQHATHDEVSQLLHTDSVPVGSICQRLRTVRSFRQTSLHGRHLFHAAGQEGLLPGGVTESPRGGYQQRRQRRQGHTGPQGSECRAGAQLRCSRDCQRWCYHCP